MKCMKLFKLSVLAVMLSTSAAFAEDPAKLPNISMLPPGAPFPGLTPEETAKLTQQSKDWIQTIFEKQGGKVGYPPGSKMKPGDKMCMFAVTISAGILAWQQALPPGAPDAIRFNAAKQWADYQVLHFCKDGGNGLKMFVLEAEAAKNRNNMNKVQEKLIPAGWKEKLDALMKKDKWSPSEVATVGTIVAILLLREALVVVP